MKFKYPIGVELTGIPEQNFDSAAWIKDEFYKNYDMLDAFKAKIRKDLVGLEGGENVANAHIDSHCFEVPSPVFEDSKTMRKWFLAVRQVMRKHGLKPHNTETVCGGGHIHVGPFDKKLKYKIARFIRRDYFLPWVFSQPDEEYSCDNGGPGKCASMNMSWHGTVEFRFFESALNWQEQWDHVRFVLKYVNWIKKTKDLDRKYNKYIFHSDKGRIKLNKITQEKAIGDFKKLLKKLRLPYKRYAKYVNRNLKPRWELDRVRR